MAKRVPKKEELQKKVKQLQDREDRIVNAVGDDLKKLYRDYAKRVQAMVGGSKELSKTDAISLQATTKMLRELKGILADAGIDDVLKSYGKRFPQMAETAATYFEAFGLKPSLAGVSKETITAIAEFGTSELGDAIEKQLIPPVRSALLQVSYGQMTRDQAVEQVMSLTEKLTPVQAVVMVDDQFSQLQRTVIAKRAERLGMEIFVYVGPDDKITSDQCQAMLHVDKHGVEGMLYKDEITVALHPKLRRNPLVGGGHPRCRHVWSAVSETFAEEAGFKFRAKDGDEEREAA